MRPLRDSLFEVHHTRGRRWSAAMGAACGGRQHRLYQRHDASSATAWRWHRLSPEGRLVYAEYKGAVGVLISQSDGGRLRNIAESAISIAIPVESDMGRSLPNASGCIF